MDCPPDNVFMTFKNNDSASNSMIVPVFLLPVFLTVRPIQNWKQAMSQFMIRFDQQFNHA